MLKKPGTIIPLLLVVTLLAVSVASVVAAPVSQADTVEVTCVEDYEVQNDDWLSRIAIDFYGDPLLYTAIFEATNAASATGGDYAALPNPDAIEIGQILCIPSLEVAQALAAGGQAVMAGDETAEAAEQEEVPAATAATTISSDERLNTLAEALSLTGLEETLSDPAAGPFTLFAPTNAAFNNLPGGGLAWLTANPEQLRQVLQYHLSPGTLTAGSIETMAEVDTLLGQPLEVTSSNGTLSIGGVELNESNLLQTTSGPIYVIDTVLLPPDIRAELLDAADEDVTAAETESTTEPEETAVEEEAGTTAETEEAAGEEAEEATTGRPEDLLSDLAEAGAPVEEAEEDTAAGPEELAVEEAPEEAAEAEAPAGGLAEGLLSDLAQAGAPVEEAEEDTTAGPEELAAEETGEAVVGAEEIAGEAGEARPAGTTGDTAGTEVIIFNFAEALAAATQSGQLQLNAPVTIFAPTSNAFALLPQNEVASLLADPVRLQTLLLHHVVPGTFLSADLAETGSLNSIIGQPLDTSVENGRYMVEDARILLADFRFGNVVIHLIDRVLLPE